MLSWQVGPAQLIHKLKTLGLGLGVVLSAMVLEVIAVLGRDPLIIFGGAQLEVILLEVVLHNRLLRVPLLPVGLLLNTLCRAVPIHRAVSVSQLEMTRLDLLRFRIAGLFGDILTHFFRLLVWFRRVICVLWALLSIQTILWTTIGIWSILVLTVHDKASTALDQC